MNKYIEFKHILIVGLVSFLSAGIILSSNWSYFLGSNKNNNTTLSSYQINTNNHYTGTYNEAWGGIEFQINILKSALVRNNIMYQQYNNIFQHNINYLHLQKNSIKSKIKIANYSITHEIEILNSMKTIMINHQYNYLKFFQDKNYIALKSIYKRGTHNSPYLSNIKTISKNITHSNTTIKNISYQAEEALIGINALSSIVSCSKILIFSKVNFDYNRIYYFSNISNNLTTVGTTENSVINNKNASNIATTNRLINYRDSSKKYTSNNYKDDKPTIKHRTAGQIIIDNIKEAKTPIGVAIGASYFGAIISTIWSLSRYISRKDKIDKLADMRAAALKVKAKLRERKRLKISRTKAIPTSLENLQEISESDEYAAENDYYRASTINFIHELYNEKIKNEEMTFVQFKAQLIDYEKITREGQTISAVSVDNYIKNKIKESLEKQIKENDDAIEIEKIKENIISIQNTTNINRELPANILDADTTTYGWFKMPKFNEINIASITNQQRYEINRQIDSAKLFLKSVPEFTVDGDDANQIIGLQMFKDLREFVSSYLQFLQNIPTSQINESERQIFSSIENTTTNVNDIFYNLNELKMLPRDLNNLMKKANVKPEDIGVYAEYIAHLNI